jgi:hypothetical protein
VGGVGIDGFSEISADGARCRFLRIGGTEQVAVGQHGVLAFQRLDHHRAGDHELDQRVEERALAVHGVEAFGFATRQLLVLGGDDLEAGLFKAGVDFTDDVLGNGVRLDDRKGALQRHGGISEVRFRATQGPRVT